MNDPVSPVVNTLRYIVIVGAIVSLMCVVGGAIATRFSSVQAFATKQEARAIACEFTLDHALGIIDAGIRTCPSRVRDPEGHEVGYFIDYACGNEPPLDVNITCRDGGIAVWVLE